MINFDFGQKIFKKVPLYFCKRLQSLFSHFSGHPQNICCITISQIRWEV